MHTKLHYVFDPLCGWCYAASTLLSMLRERFGDQLELVFHPGLLFAKPCELDESYREHIITADLRIATISGVEFGEPYIKRVRTAPVLRYHSEPPAAAVMAVNALEPQLGLRMLEAIQQSHYQQGEDVSDMATLNKLAQKLGLHVEAFEQSLNDVRKRLPGIAVEARNLMHKVGGSGFPVLVLEHDGEYQTLDHGSMYGKPDALSNKVAQLISAQ